MHSTQILVNIYSFYVLVLLKTLRLKGTSNSQRILLNFIALAKFLSSKQPLLLFIFPSAFVNNEKQLDSHPSPQKEAPQKDP